MNAATTILLMAAAAAQKARQEAEDAFRLAGATSAERARPLDELGLAENTAVPGTLRATGIVRAVDARGRVLSPEDSAEHATAWYLDETAILAERTASGVASGRRARIVVVVIAIILLVVMTLLALVVPGRSEM